MIFNANPNFKMYQMRIMYQLLVVGFIVILCAHVKQLNHTLVYIVVCLKSWMVLSLVKVI